MTNEKKHTTDRRTFIKRTLTAAGALAAAPAIVPSSVFGKTAPGNRITMGCIGVGRMGMGDLRGFLEHDDIQVVAVCDVDTWRLNNAKNEVETSYSRKQNRTGYRGCDTYRDFRELLARSDIDAVQICTPDFWHALPAIEAARAGKDIFLQKPLTFRINEGRMLSDAVAQYGVILQVGSQQRSDARFRHAAELVRNGRIGTLKHVKVGFGRDPFTGPHPVTPVPAELDYDFWLGPAPARPYIEQRVHPVKSYSRPGWLRTDDYCCGMITGWGSHHLDSAHWGMGMEYSGPVKVSGTAEYSREGIWDVHGPFNLDYTYANGVTMNVAQNDINKQGVVFEGSEGWVYVRRGFIDASPVSLLTETFGPDEIHLYRSNNHKRNFIDCMKTRKEPVAPVEIGHRSCSACVLGYIAMRTGETISWDPEKEKILNNPAAAAMTSRPYRAPWRL